MYEKEHARLVDDLLSSMSAEEVQCMQDRINEIRESRESKDPALRLRVIALEKRVKTLEAQTATTADSPVSA